MPARLRVADPGDVADARARGDLRFLTNNLLGLISLSLPRPRNRGREWWGLEGERSSGVTALS